MNVSPVVVVAYNRPSHLRETLSALAANELAEKTPVYVYIDGPRSERDHEPIRKVQEFVSRCADLDTAAFPISSIPSSASGRGRDQLLGEIGAITPWAALVVAIEPLYPRRKWGRPPIRLEPMYGAQQFSNRSDEGIEDAGYDSQAIRRIVGIDLSRETRRKPPRGCSSAGCCNSTTSPR